MKKKRDRKILLATKKIKRHQRRISWGSNACGLACLCTIPNTMERIFFRKQLRDIKWYCSQSWIPPFSGLIQAAQKIGYEAKGFEAGSLKHLAEPWRPCNSPCGSGSKTESIWLFILGLARWRTIVSDPGVGILGMEESELTAQWKSAFSFDLQPYRSYFQNKAVVTQSKALVLFLWLQQIFQFSIVATVIGSLNGWTGLSTAK